MGFRKDKTEGQAGRAQSRIAGRRKALVERESGQAMVEMALVLPLLLLILTGIISFGIILEQYQVLTITTSDGARAFALSRNQTSPALAASDPCAYAATIAEAAASTLNVSKITYTMYFTPPGGSMSTFSNVTASAGCAGTTLTTADINGTVQMVASYPVTPLVFGWAAKNLSMTVSASEQIQ